MAVDTTWSIFLQLLSESIDENGNLSDTLSAGLKTRVTYLSKEELIALTSENVASYTGDATVDEATSSITIASGASTSDVIWDLTTLGTPVRVLGSKSAIGALVGNIGEGSNSPVANDDISMFYRTSTSGTWIAFTRNTVLDSISTIQFKATIAAQGSDADLPQLFVFTEQE
jgi:hypothetical protein